MLVWKKPLSKRINPMVLFFNFDAASGLFTSLGAEAKDVAALEPLQALGLQTWQDGGLSHSLLKLTTDSLIGPGRLVLTLPPLPGRLTPCVWHALTPNRTRCEPHHEAHVVTDLRAPTSREVSSRKLPPRQSAVAR